MQYRGMTAEVVGYIKTQYGVEADFLWARTPTNAAFRRPDNRKWFAALLMDMPRTKLSLPGEGKVDILDLKCDPRMIVSLTDRQKYLPGYHMNKEHWITLVLDGSIPGEEVFAMIDLSYQLAGKK